MARKMVYFIKPYVLYYITKGDWFELYEKEEAKKSARAHQKANDFWMQTSSN
jgi:hypothetical protein